MCVADRQGSESGVVPSSNLIMRSLARSYLNFCAPFPNPRRGYCTVCVMRGAGHASRAHFYLGSLSLFAMSSCCLKAAAPIKPPIPIDSTAVLGTSINAPFSFRPS